jgi:hypothetical protein
MIDRLKFLIKDLLKNANEINLEIKVESETATITQIAPNFINNKINIKFKTRFNIRVKDKLNVINFIFSFDVNKIVITELKISIGINRHIKIQDKVNGNEYSVGKYDCP